MGEEAEIDRSGDEDEEVPEDLFLSEPDAEVLPEEPPEPEVETEAGSFDGVGAYLRDIGRYPLISGEQEVALAQRIENGERATRCLGERSVPARRRRELERERQDGLEAREQMIRANLRLVVSIARRYRATGIPLLDLIQEGNLGLIRAVEKFDWRRGYKFSTYATWWIRQAVQRGIADRGRMIRLPVHVHDMLLRVRKTRTVLEGQLGREASDEELARVSRVSTSRVRELQGLSKLPLSLELPMGEEGSTSLGDLVHDPDADQRFDEVFRGIQRDDLVKVLGTLPEREQRILELRFGLSAEEPLTLEQVGARFGLTRERIRQLESKALAKLRHPSRSATLLELG
jgi:RNA polymerase sigma factor (sigma-70 family)